MRLLKYSLFPVLVFVFFSCTSLVLKPVDFSWPLETVLKVDKNFNISETRYSFTVNVHDLLLGEYGPAENTNEISLRVIRDQSGYYYITSEGFRNIYVFEESDASLSLVNKINIPGADNFKEPVFNQRAPFIEFISGGEKSLINKDGVVR